MQLKTPRRYFNKVAMMVATVSGAPGLLAQTPAPGKSSTTTTGDQARRNDRIHDGVYYFPALLSKTGANLATHVANGGFACPKLEFGG